MESRAPLDAVTHSTLHSTPRHHATYFPKRGNVGIGTNLVADPIAAKAACLIERQETLQLA
jgi:hypothetical protein